MIAMAIGQLMMAGGVVLLDPQHDPKRWAGIALVALGGLLIVLGSQR